MAFDPTDTETPGATGEAEGGRRSGSFGDYLRRQRTLRGVSLDDIARATRIHLGALQALEEDDRTRLPADVFVRGFIRNYALQVGLDPEETVSRYIQAGGEAFAGGGPLPSEREELTGSRAIRSRPPGRSGRWLLLGLLAGLVGLALYLLLGPVLQGPQEMLPAPEHPTGQATPPSGELPAPAPVPSPSAPPAPALPAEVTPASPVASPPPGSIPPPGPPAAAGRGAVPAGSSAGMTAPGPEGPAAAPGSPPPLAQGAAADPGSGLLLEARFTARNWVRVELDGQTLRDTIYEPGQSQAWRAKERIFIHAGNGGGVLVTVNGQELGPLGRPGEIVRRSFPESAVKPRP
ncbi:MAG: helix-turn-helix domain-containing protein [Thermodesulfobacteriota bacterium]